LKCSIIYVVHLYSQICIVLPETKTTKEKTERYSSLYYSLTIRFADSESRKIKRCAENLYTSGRLATMAAKKKAAKKRTVRKAAKKVAKKRTAKKRSRR
jgi:hypothetical protein